MLSIEKHPFAHQTLRLRTFLRQFASSTIPKDYYEFLRGKISLDELFSRFPRENAKAKAEAWQATLGETPWNEVTAKITSALRGAENWVLIGGPPCQPYSLAGRARAKGIKDYVPEDDKRHFYYREYLHVIAAHWPAIFVMENVKGLLSSTLDDKQIFHRILEDLENPAKPLHEGSSGRRRIHTYRLWSLVEHGMFGDFRPEDYVIKAECLGVPQARHRVIILGIRDDMNASPRLLPEMKPVPASKVLSGLPRLRSGLSEESDSAEAWREKLREALDRRWLSGARRSGGEEVYALVVDTLNQLREPRCGRGAEYIPYDASVDYSPEWFLDPRIEGVCNHQTRGHIVKDLHRYLYAACYAKVWGRSPRLREFPPDLLPEHKNVERALKNGGLFGDRFRVQLFDKPSTTVTSHISKDGHYYIHPDPLQCRSLTVREAARLQTFPDNYFFMGPRTSQYVQVGNAVPPLMALKIGERVYDVLKRAGCPD
jgi:DNA (cytosine-5)-methyltransferase 1